ncbi:MAG: response regulator transcription factor [Candidatus Obscuribacterales bacterium]|nr:response regulator transcription factor [Candidatus Obscuribacterales bacterium]
MPEEVKQIRILLVEDHLLTRIGLKAVLDRTEDLKVVAEAEDGEQAVSLVEQINPDVILMDVGMPVLDGIEASKIIKSKHAEMAIVMLTSHDNERDIFASLAAGAGGYCLKDVEPERLYSAIRSVKAGDIWLDSTIASKVLKQYGQMQAAPQESSSYSPNSSITKLSDKLPEPLSPRELEVLHLLVEGLSNQEIADKLIISLATAKTHVRNILNKLAVDDRTQAAVQAMRRGLV